MTLKCATQHPWSEDEDVAAQILEDDIQFDDEDNVSDECKDFLHQMLKKNPSERLRIGMDMTSHPYFAGVYAIFVVSRTLFANHILSDWEAMRNRTVLPLWVPDFVKGHHFFEDWGTIEHFVPGSAPSKDDEAIFSDFVYTSSGMQYNNLKDAFDCSSPDLGNEESLDNSNPFDPPQGIFGHSFGHLFASAYEVDLDEEEDLWAFDIEDDNDGDLPVHMVEVNSPMVSTPESHTHMLPSFHSGSSLLDLVESECPAEPELLAIAQPLPLIICHAPEPVAMQAEYVSETDTTLELIVECVETNAVVEHTAPELVESPSLPAIPLTASSGSLVDSEPIDQFSFPVLKPQAEPVAEHTNVIAVPESMDEISPPGAILQPVPRLLQFAMPPSTEVTIDFTRPAPFQAVLEPLVECAEPTYEPTLTPSMEYIVPKEQIARENRAISLYKKVVAWLRKLLPWSKKREDAFGLTIPSCEDMSLWESIRWKFQKMWVPKVKHNQRLQRKRTIL